MASSTSLTPTVWPANGGEIDFLTMQTDPAASGDEDLLVMEGIAEGGQAGVRPGGKACRPRPGILWQALHGGALR